MWDTESGDPLLQPIVPPLSPCARSCALSPDGSIAAAGFDDGSLMVSYVLSRLIGIPSKNHSFIGEWNVPIVAQ